MRRETSVLCNDQIGRGDLMFDVAKFITGDEDEFAVIVSELTPAFLRYTYSILGCQADAEDAVQNTFIKAWRKKHILRDKQALMTFLYRIAYSCSIDIIRAKKWFRAPESEPHIKINAISDMMEQVLFELSPADRSVIYCRVVCEYSYASLAAIHGKTEAWVRKRYQLTRQRMAKRLCELGYKQNIAIKSEVLQ